MAQPFRFRLQKVLDVAEERLKASEQRLALTIRDKNREEARLQLAQDQLQGLYQHLRKELGGGELSLCRMDWYQQYLNRATRHVKGQKEKVAETAQRVCEMRQEVFRAWVRAESLKTLREKSRAEHTREVRHKENREMDEMAVTGYLRHGRGRQA